MVGTFGFTASEPVDGGQLIKRNDLLCRCVIKGGSCTLSHIFVLGLLVGPRRRCLASCGYVQVALDRGVLAPS